jgi:flagellar hook-associated protein 1
MTGGEIGGLLETRTNLLDKAQNELGLIGAESGDPIQRTEPARSGSGRGAGPDIFQLPEVVVRSGHR